MSRAINDSVIRSAVVARWLETKGEPTTIKQLAARSGYSESALRRATETLHRDLCWTETYVESIDGYGTTRAKKAMALRPTDAALCEMILALRGTLEDTKAMFKGIG